MKGLAGFLALFLAALAQGCSSARLSEGRIDSFFYRGRWAEAIEGLKKGLEKQGDEGRDALLYLLDLGLALHVAGDYEASNAFFFRAQKMADIKDYTSLSTEAATLLVSQNATQYSGEDFEKVLIHTYLAMNFALLQQFEEAAVEARLVNHILKRLIQEGKKPYVQNAFALYLSALLHESQGDDNDAYVDYQAVASLAPHYQGIGLDLWCCAKKLRLPEDQKKWQDQFQLSRVGQEQACAREQGEVIVLFENGLAPIKRPHPDFQAIPKFYPRWNPVSSARVFVDAEDRGRTVLLNDIEATAIHDLEEKYRALMIKKGVGMVAKGFVGWLAANRTKNPMLGFLAFFLLWSQDEADLRSWRWLPKDLQVLRVPLSQGPHKIGLVLEGADVILEKQHVVLPKTKKVFANFRFIP